jgi:hypothetical protein
MYVNVFYCSGGWGGGGGGSGGVVCGIGSLLYTSLIEAVYSRRGHNLPFLTRRLRCRRTSLLPFDLLVAMGISNDRVLLGLSLAEFKML